MLTEKIFISFEQLENVHEIFRKCVTYNNNKSHKKPPSLSLEDAFLVKP